VRAQGARDGGVAHATDSWRCLRMTRALLAGLVLMTATTVAHAGEVDRISAGTLGQVEAHGKLRWGMDAQGGAPYVFQNPMDPNQIIGFEVDVAEAIARQLHV